VAQLDHLEHGVLLGELDQWAVLGTLELVGQQVRLGGQGLRVVLALMASKVNLGIRDYLVPLGHLVLLETLEELACLELVVVLATLDSQVHNVLFVIYNIHGVPKTSTCLYYRIFYKH